MCSHKSIANVSNVPDPVEAGIFTKDLSSWDAFYGFIRKGEFHGYIWRGQSDASWTLQSSFDRYAAASFALDPKERLSIHKERFKRAARGRRGANPADLSEDAWWALGQHHGLATPLLDWTRSPFVALYFAFAELVQRGQSHKRAVFGLNRDKITKHQSKETGDLSGKQGKTFEGIPENDQLAIIDPMVSDNPRLVSQGALFTKTPPGITVEQWLFEKMPMESPEPSVDEEMEDEAFVNPEAAANLVKIIMPNSDRNSCLIALDQMNINASSLFPDLAGASDYCNISLENPEYGV